MEDEEILQFIADERAQGRSNQVIGRSLQMRGVGNFEEYLKKKTILRPRNQVREREVRNQRKLQLLREDKSLVLRFHL